MWGAEPPNLPGSGVLVYQNFVITFPVTFFYILMFGASVLSEKVQCSIYTLNNGQSWLIILCKQLKRREHDTNTIYMHRPLSYENRATMQSKEIGPGIVHESPDQGRVKHRCRGPMSEAQAKLLQRNQVLRSRKLI